MGVSSSGHAAGPGGASGGEGASGHPHWRTWRALLPSKRADSKQLDGRTAKYSTIIKVIGWSLESGDAERCFENCSASSGMGLAEFGNHRCSAATVTNICDHLDAVGAFSGSRSRKLIEYRFRGWPAAKYLEGRGAIDGEGHSFYSGMDAYTILGVPRDASRPDIRAAYLRAISKWHPDKWHSSSEAVKEEARLRSVALNYAYHCLEDELRRRRYDQFGAADMESFLIAERDFEAEAKRKLEELLTNQTMAGQQRGGRGGLLGTYNGIPVSHCL